MGVGTAIGIGAATLPFLLPELLRTFRMASGNDLESAQIEALRGDQTAQLLANAMMVASEEEDRRYKRSRESSDRKTAIESQAADRMLMALLAHARSGETPAYGMGSLAAGMQGMQGIQGLGSTDPFVNTGIFSG